MRLFLPQNSANKRFGLFASSYYTCGLIDSNRKSKAMNLNLEIGYEQLLKLVMQLPSKQRKQLAEAIQKAETPPSLQPNNLQELLLTGPVWTEEEYQNVLKTREQLN